MESVIRLDQPTKTYGRRGGLASLSLDIARGEVRVLGLDPRSDAVAVQRRIGYLAGDFVVDTRQTVEDCLTFLANLRGGIPRAGCS